MARTRSGAKLGARPCENRQMPMIDETSLREYRQRCIASCPNRRITAAPFQRRGGSVRHEALIDTSAAEPVDRFGTIEEHGRAIRRVAIARVRKRLASNEGHEKPAPARRMRQVHKPFSDELLHLSVRRIRMREPKADPEKLLIVDVDDLNIRRAPQTFDRQRGGQ